MASKGIVHRRHFVFVRPDYFFIYDVVELRGATVKERKLEWHAHSTVSLDEESMARPGLVMARSDLSWTPVKDKGLASVRGIAGFGGDYAEIEWLRLEGKVTSNAPAVLGVALYPFERERPKVSVKMIDGQDRAAHFVVEHPLGTDHLLFGQEGMEMNSGGIRFSGACALVRFDDDRPVDWAAAQALVLAAGEKITMIDSKTPRDAEGNL